MKGVQRSGADVREWREERGLTQADLAQLLGITSRTLANHENADVVPTLVVWALRGLEPMLKAGAAAPTTGPRPRAMKRGYAVIRDKPFALLAIYDQLWDAAQHAVMVAPARVQPGDFIEEDGRRVWAPDQPLPRE